MVPHPGINGELSGAGAAYTGLHNISPQMSAVAAAAVAAYGRTQVVTRHTRTLNVPIRIVLKVTFMNRFTTSDPICVWTTEYNFNVLLFVLRTFSFCSGIERDIRYHFVKASTDDRCIMEPASHWNIVIKWSRNNIYNLKKMILMFQPNSACDIIRAVIIFWPADSAETL